MTSIFGTTGNYNVDAARGGAYQPINYVIAATAASDGTATFLFDAVALSNTWTMTINCATAPDTARFTAATGGTQFGQFKGSNSWGPLQLQGGDRLQVTATGLIPGTVYQMAGYGYANIVNDPQIVYPVAYADSVTSSVEQIYLGSFLNKTLGGAGYQNLVTIPVSPSYRSLYLIITYQSGGSGSYLPSNISIIGVGNITNFGYASVLVPYGNRVGEAIFRIPIFSSADTSITIQTQNAGGSGVYNVYYGADLADTDLAVYPEGTFNVAITGNTSSTPLFVESITGSTTAVTNTSSTPLYVAATSVGGGFPVSNYAGSLSVSLVNAAGGYGHTNEYGGALSTYVTTTSPGPATLLAAPASGYSNRIHSVSYSYSGAASTTPVQALITTGSVAVTIAALYYPYQTNMYVGGLLTTSIVRAVSSSTSSCTFGIFYDVVSTPTIS